VQRKIYKLLSTLPILPKKKAGEILSDIHEGKPQDKNLAKALSESPKSYRKPQSYLKK